MSVLFEPTAEQRRMVRAFSGLGVQQEAMADHLGIDSNTLRKHFREELDRGTVEANVKVAQSLFQMATQGKNGAAAIFWMKSRGRWRDKHEDEASADGKTPPGMVVSFRWADRSDDAADGSDTASVADQTEG